MKLEQYIELFLNFKLDLHPGISGEYSLKLYEYYAGRRLHLIHSNYSSYLSGYEPMTIVLKNDYHYYDLFKNNQRLMSSDPSILFTQYVPYIRAKGKVLLGGYGLGILAKMLCYKDSVTAVTSVEYGGDIIKLCGFSDQKLTLIEGDFYSYIRNNDLSGFDYIYIDTFTHNDDTIYPEKILPMKKYFYENYPTIPFDFWEEDLFKSEYLVKKLKNENSGYNLLAV